MLFDYFLSLFPYCEYRQWVRLVSATLLQFCIDCFDTLHVFSSWYELWFGYNY